MELENAKNELGEKLNHFFSKKKVDDLDFLNFLLTDHLKRFGILYQKETKILYDKNKNHLDVSFEFPDCMNVKIDKLPEKQTALLIKDALKSAAISIGYAASIIVSHLSLSGISVTAKSNWFDPADGNERSGTICKINSTTKIIEKLKLQNVKIDPCFKNLNGKCYDDPFYPKTVR